MPSKISVAPLDCLVFGIYFLVSVIVGLSVGGKQRNLATFLLAGHQMPWGIVAVSIMAALFSGITFLGAPAEVYSHNLVYLWTLAAYIIATPITTVVFLPFFYRLNFYTAYEYLEHRFDLRLRRLSSAAFIFRVCLWLSLALYAPSLVISEVTGLPVWLAILSIGFCTVLYTSVGGMKAVIYTEVMQFCILVLGIICIFFVALTKIPGGFAGAWTIAEEHGKTVLFDFDFSPTARVTFWGGLIGGIFTNLVALVTDQISVQRYLTAGSLPDAKRALWVKIPLTLMVVPLFYLTGLVLFSFYQTHPASMASLASPDRVLPNFVSQHLPSPIPGLLIAAILSATMSAVSSGLNSLTTATLMDFVLHGQKKADHAGEAGQVRQARYWTAFFGFVVTFAGLVVGRLGSLVEASVKIAGFFGGPLLGIFFLGVFSRRANSRGAFVGSVIAFFSITLLGLLTPLSFMWYAMIGCGITYGVGEIVSRFSAPPRESQRAFSLAGQLEAEQPTRRSLSALR